MGMWLIQEVRRLENDRYSFAELAELAANEEGFRSLIPCNHTRFLNPHNMIEEMRRSCQDSGQHVPTTIGQVARCIFDSLALSYYSYLNELEELTGTPIDVVQIVGGGSNNELLCQLTADVTGREVLAGPTESTALGNIAVQLIRTRDISGIHEVRKIIGNSFEIKSYLPREVLNFSELINRWNLVSRF